MALRSKFSLSAAVRAPRAAARSTRVALRELGALSVQTAHVIRGLRPLMATLAHSNDVTRDELRVAVDALFEPLYAHPLNEQIERTTRFLRAKRLIPNEQSTEELIRFVVEQAVARSPVPVPDAIVNEFWAFFEELFASPDVKGLGDMSLDMTRLAVRTYEPMLVEIINLLKAGKRFNQWQRAELMRRAGVIRQDAVIIRRQIKALRHIRPFFQADPKDFSSQARIVADMVSEFGPFFVKMAQAAASSADFLPEEIAKELAVFHEDVPPMSAAEVVAAFEDSVGKAPSELYLNFDPAKPVRSGSIGSIYVAKKPFVEADGREVLREVVIKVGRHNLDREFTIGKLVLGLAIMSSQYWAPHSKLAPFLQAMQDQVDEFIEGFIAELDFEAEARNHQRFYARSLTSTTWRVPQLHSASARVLEMENLADATSLMRALDNMPAGQRRRFQRQLSEKLLFTLLSHVLFYGELHGDLHPGNIMVDRSGGLYLIDWGNCVSLDGKWGAVWNYLAGAVLADPELLADALIAISTQPNFNDQRRDDIVDGLRETLARKGVVQLTRSKFLAELRRGGLEGLHLRGQTVLHLMSNTQSLGVVVRGEYLHLSRSLYAAAGSVGTIYQGDSPWRLAGDVARGLSRFPLRAAREGLLRRIARRAGKLPLPSRWRQRLPAAEVPTLALPAQVQDRAA